MKKSCLCIKKISILLLLGSVIMCFSCNNEKKEKRTEVVSQEVEKKPFFKLSLAQWSLHKFVNEEHGSPFLFPVQAKEMGFEGVDYVSQLFKNEIEKLGFEKVIDSLKKVSKSQNITNVLIMVDNEGDLASGDLKQRDLAVENHKRWVDAAAILGCHSIRVNTFGTMDAKLWVPSVADGLRKLSEYAAIKNINVLCENHGWFSSDPPKLLEAIHLVNMPNCGTLPDFGNWCIKRTKNYFEGDCVEVYADKYQGIELMLTKAKAVSAKSYDFDENGNETTLDYPRIIRLVKESGYTNYIGVEYEGSRFSEKEGIKATRDLLLKSAAMLK